MNIRRKAALPLMGALLAAVAPSAGAYERPAGAWQQASVATDGSPGKGNSGAFVAADSGRAPAHNQIAMTADGRYVAFPSAASNLVANDRNRNVDVFLRDRRSGKTYLVTAPVPGTTAQTIAAAATAMCGADDPSISADGRYVAFKSCYPYLDGKPTQSGGDVFVHDMVTGKNVRVSASSTGGLANGQSRTPSMTSNGRYVAFTSTATDLVSNYCGSAPVDTVQCGVVDPLLLGVENVYVRDMKTGVTKLVSANGSGAVGDGWSESPVISADGHYVAFVSSSDNFTANDHNVCSWEFQHPSCSDVYLKDLKTGAVQLVSVGVDGNAPAGVFEGAGLGNSPGHLAVSGDRYVVFTDDASGLVPNDADKNRTLDSAVYMRDIVTQRTTRISVSSTGSPLWAGTNISIDGTGRHVVFDLPLGAGCPVGNSQPLVEYDVATGYPWFVGGMAGGPACSSHSHSADMFPVLSSNGRLVAFESDGANLAPNATSGQWDVYVQPVGPDVGAGNAATGKHVEVAGDPGFAISHVLQRAAGSPSAVSSDDDGKLVAASVAYRPPSADLFLRLSVARMRSFSLVSPVIVYGVDVTAAGTQYQVRVAKTSAIDASFGLFAKTPTGWRFVATLRGGYGTTGEEVVVAVPLSAVGLQAGGRLSGLTAFSAVGSYLTGAARVLDSLALSR